MERNAIIIQARMSSRRFPGKMLELLAGKPLVQYVFDRCLQASIKKILVATSTEKGDDQLADYCKAHAIPVFRGPLENVLARYIAAARSLDAENIIRVCGDTPLVDIGLAQRLLELLIKEKLDYAACERESCLSGFYSEAVSLTALVKSASLTKEAGFCEHVTKYIVDNRGGFKTRFLTPRLNPSYAGNTCLTIDYPEHLVHVNALLTGLADPYAFGSRDILQALRKE